MLITRVWAEQPGSYFCISSKTRSKRWEDHFFSRKQLRAVTEFIREHRDRDLYFCPHSFVEPRRIKDYAAKTNLLWADLDEADPAKVQPMPTIAWRSSPGRYAAIWQCREDTTEALNRRLTYHVGADRGGWDLTQVLRIPGTYNYKYPGAPQVRLLWDDGPIHSVREIEALLPTVDATAEAPDAIKIYKRYEEKFPPFVRRNLLKGKPQQGKRSEVLWRLTQELLEVGCTEEETFVLIRHSPWNKFSGRRDEEDQIRRDIRKALSHKLETAAPIEPKEEADPEFIVALSEVEEKELDWIWYPYMARGEITLLEGDPGGGKSYLAQMLCAAVVDGKRLPMIRDNDKPTTGSVLYFTIENTAATIAKRRMLDNNTKRMDKFFQGEKFFTLEEDDLEDVFKALEQVRPAVVVFDPVNTYLGKADIHNSKEAQQALAIFKDIAQRFNCAVILVRHLTKSTREKALYRGQGSIAFIGIARFCLTVGLHPNDSTVRVMAVTKWNVTARPKSITFSIHEKRKCGLGCKHDHSEFLWGEFSDLTSDEILSIAETQKEKAGDVEEFVRSLLPEKLKTLEHNANARGITALQLRAALTKLGASTTDGIVALPGADGAGDTQREKASPVRIVFPAKHRPSSASRKAGHTPRRSGSSPRKA